jgi:hypothetical protein
LHRHHIRSADRRFAVHNQIVAVFTTEERIMLREALHTKYTIVVVMAGVFLVSCASTSTTYTNGNATVDVIVKGEAEQLTEFDGKFRSLVGTERLGCAVYVGMAVSSDCEVLKTATGIPSNAWVKYVFYSAHTSVYQQLGTALNQVSTVPSTVSVTVTPTIPHAAGYCASYPPPCNIDPMCPNLGDCSKYRAPCTKCQ